MGYKLILSDNRVMKPSLEAWNFVFRLAGPKPDAVETSSEIPTGQAMRRAAVEPAVQGRVEASQILAYCAFGLLGLIWGSNFIFMKWAAASITPEQIVLLRIIFGFAPLLIFALMTRSLHLRDLNHTHHFLAMALLATIFYYIAFAKGTALLLSSVAGMLSGAIPIFTFLMAWIFLRDEKINVRSLVGTLVGFAGVLLIARPWSGGGDISTVGVLWMIGGSLSVGCSFVYARKYISPLGLSPLSLTTYQIGLALILLLGTVDRHGITMVFADRGAAVGLILGLGLCGTGLAYVLYYVLVDRLGAVAASGVTYVPPVVALLIGYFSIGEPIRLLDVGAMAAILVGVGLLQSGRRAGVRKVARELRSDST
jgi:drug/metabolite transporter (DMT)-like permease